MWWPETMLCLKYITVIVTSIPWIYEAVKYFSEKLTQDTQKHKQDLTTCDKYEVLTFREDKYQCRKHCHWRNACKKPDCAYRYLSKICNIVGNAVESLDICVCFITCEDLIGSVLLASQRGVVVRIITDADMMDFGGSLEILEIYGVQIHKVKSDYKMHHKFALIDNNVLIEGSSNWTIQAFTGNWENIIITSHEPLVKIFVDIFTELWDMLEQEEKEKNKLKNLS